MIQEAVGPRYVSLSEEVFLGAYALSTATLAVRLRTTILHANALLLMATVGAFVVCLLIDHWQDFLESRLLSLASEERILAEEGTKPIQDFSIGRVSGSERRGNGTRVS